VVVVDLGLLWALNVEVLGHGNRLVDLLKNLSLASSLPSRGYDRDWIFFILSYDVLFYGFRWYLGTMNGQT